MKRSKQTYKDVAKHCSSYERTTASELSNCVDEDCTSCLNCSHFAPDEHCILELFDHIEHGLNQADR